MNKSESIILSKKPLGEADLLITFLSLNDGKIKGVAKNAKKSKKRFSGLFENGYVLNLDYRFRGSSQLAAIDQASLISPKISRQAKIFDAPAIWLSLELADRYLQDHDGTSVKFELLKRFLISIHEGRLERTILIFFLYKWISLCGFLPEITGDSLQAPYNLRPGTAKSLKMIMSGDLGCDITDEQFGDALLFIFRYSTEILGKPLKNESVVPMLLELGK